MGELRVVLQENGRRGKAVEKVAYKGLSQRIVVRTDNSGESLRRHHAREPVRASIDDGLRVHARGTDQQGRQQLVTEDGLSDGDAEGAAEVLANIHYGHGDGEVFLGEAFLESNEGLSRVFSVSEMEH